MQSSPPLARTGLSRRALLRAGVMGVAAASVAPDLFGGIAAMAHEDDHVHGLPVWSAARAGDRLLALGTDGSTGLFELAVQGQHVSLGSRLPVTVPEGARAVAALGGALLIGSSDRVQIGVQVIDNRTDHVAPGDRDALVEDDLPPGVHEVPITTSVAEVHLVEGGATTPLGLAAGLPLACSFVEAMTVADGVLHALVTGAAAPDDLYADVLVLSSSADGGRSWAHQVLDGGRGEARHGAIAAGAVGVVVGGTRADGTTRLWTAGPGGTAPAAEQVPDGVDLLALAIGGDGARRGYLQRPDGEITRRSWRGRGRPPEDARTDTSGPAPLDAIGVAGSSQVLLIDAGGARLDG